MPEELRPDPSILEAIVSTPMPYGKYKGRTIKNLPTHYLEWMSKEGFPKGRLGMILSTTHTIKINGLEFLLEGLGR